MNSQNERERSNWRRNIRYRAAAMITFAILLVGCSSGLNGIDGVSLSGSHADTMARIEVLENCLPDNLQDQAYTSTVDRLVIENLDGNREDHWLRYEEALRQISDAAGLSCDATTTAQTSTQ